MKILIHAPLSPYSGYGKDGIGLSRALVKAGVDVYLQPTEVQAPLPEEVLELLGKAPQAPFDVIISHIDPMRLEATPEMRQATKLLIGWTMWEWNSLSNATGRSKFRRKYKDFDALIAYDEVSAQALAEHYSGPIIVLQGGFEPDEFEPVERDWFGTFRFLQMGVLSPRKNPAASIKAFQKARDMDPEFRKHARLSMKTSVPGLHSKWQDLFVDDEENEHGEIVEVPKLRIFYDVWPQDVVKEYMASGHVLLAPSRGEGKNLPALEFMATGGTVIASKWGGHMQWLHDDYAYGLDVELAPTDIAFPNALGAEVDVDQMAEVMLETFRNRAKTKEKGEIAARTVRQAYSWDAVVRRLFLRLASLSDDGVSAAMAFSATRLGPDDD